MPSTLADFFEDFSYSDGLSYEYAINYKAYSEFSNIKDLMKLLSSETENVLLYDKRVSDDEVEMNTEIYHGNDDIVIRCSTKTALSEKVPHLAFSKDKDGNTYIYCSYYGFGCKLQNSETYDKLSEWINNC